MLSVVKLNNFDYAGDDLTNFFIRIEAHNLLFSNIPYEMIGFAYNSQNEFCAVLVQPYVRAKREATENEIQHYMESLGFIMDYPDEYLLLLHKSIGRRRCAIMHDALSFFVHLEKERRTILLVWFFRLNTYLCGK